MQLVVNPPDLLVEEFEEAAEARGDDPDAALERLMLEYVRQASTIAELFAGKGEPATSLEDYDTRDDRPLGYEAAAALPSYAGGLEIDPADVTDERLPQYREVKREVILGVLRYQHRQNRDGNRRHEAIVRREEVATAAEAVVGEIEKDDEYKRKEYIERVMDELLVRNPGDEWMAFFSPSDALDYLESLEPGNEQKEENDVYHLSQHLIERYGDEIDVEAVNDVRRRFTFEPLE